MNSHKINNICDYCGRTATLVGLYENPNKNYPTGWYCLECISRLKADGWSGSEKPSELELRLRKEIIANLNQIYALLPERNADNTINCIYLTLKVTDMLKVLWGEK